MSNGFTSKVKMGEGRILGKERLQPPTSQPPTRVVRINVACAMQGGDAVHRQCRSNESGEVPVVLKIGTQSSAQATVLPFK
jgi:hypothetical protein